MVSAIVLAAGLSSRMGKQNKLLLPILHKTVIETTIDQIYEAGMKEIIVVTGHEAEAIADSLKDRNIRLVFNKDYKNGLTSSIQAGVKEAKGEGFMICLSDMYAITTEEYKYLNNEFNRQHQSDPRCICVPRWQNKKGNPVTFSSYYKDEILQHKEPEGCKGIVQKHQRHIHWIDMQSNHILLDLDTAEEYRILNKE